MSDIESLKHSAIVFLFGWLILINIIAFAMYGIDKKKAQKHKWRIPEAQLLLAAALGGGVGSYLGMETFRHKTKHWRFNILVPLFMVVWVIITGALIYYF